MLQKYHINNLSELDSPSLLIYKEIVAENIDKMIEIAGSTGRLIPHVKTNKMVEVVQLMLEKGITKFKCSTIAEAEMVAMAGGEYALIAHQLVGPKIDRLLKLIAAYPATKFASLVDDSSVITTIQDKFESLNQTAEVHIDVNSGMDRSGAEINKLDELVATIDASANVILGGWHVYDGHQREPDFKLRKKEINAGFTVFETYLEGSHYWKLPVIAGGSPAFTVHAQNDERLCSPGTCVFWDWGYGDRFAEQPFEYAAMILTRVISKPAKGIVTIDLGHKAVAAENPIDKRIRFLNIDGYELVSQSEEHGVMKVSDWENVKVGDELLGVPYHVCPTVNLYGSAYVVEKGTVNGSWKVIGRDRQLTV